MIMKGRFILDYLDENNFKKLERSLKKYNMVAYKKLMFDFYPKLRSGEFVGELISINKHEQTETYDLRLPTDSLFVKVYGEVKLNYTVNKANNTVILNNLEPKETIVDISARLISNKASLKFKNEEINNIKNALALQVEEKKIKG